MAFSYRGTLSTWGLDFLSYDKYNEDMWRQRYDKMGRPKEDNAKRKSITVRLSEKTHAELTRYAAEHKITMTEVALRSLEEYLSKRK